jgi:hypothetical protein
MDIADRLRIDTPVGQAGMGGGLAGAALAASAPRRPQRRDATVVSQRLEGQGNPRCVERVQPSTVSARLP